MSSLKRAVNYLNLLRRAEGEEVGEVLTTCTGAGSAFSSSTQLLSASGEALVPPGKLQPRQHRRFLWSRHCRPARCALG